MTDLKCQCVNLLLNYISFSLVWAITKFIFGRWVNGEISTIDLFLIWCKPIDLYWYLYDLIILYLIFSIDKVRNTPSLIMTGLLLLASCFSTFIPVHWFDIPNLCHNAFFFYIGMNLNLLLREMDNRRTIQGLILCMTNVMFIAFWNGKPYTEQSILLCYNFKPIVNTIIALGTVLMLWQLFKKTKTLYENRVLLLLGEHSLEIYLIHNFFTAMFRLLFKLLGFNYAIFSVLLNLILSTAIPLGLSLICSRIGIYKFVFRPASLMKLK